MSTPVPVSPTRPLTAFGVTHPGREREQNEDAFGLFPERGLFILADGMGGRAGGQIASQIALEQVERFYREKLAAPRDPWPYPIDKNTSTGANLLRVALKVANDAIRQAAATDAAHARMGATIAAMAIGQTQVNIATLGDVRVYRVRTGALERLTRDHSVVEEIRMARPEITDEELARVASRNVVTKALGTRKDADPTVRQYAIEAGDVYLMCCDGLWDEIGDPVIGGIINDTPDLEAACQRLVDAANEAGGHDNITAVLVRVDG